MGADRCFKCDRPLFPGQRKFQVTINILSDPDALGEEFLYLEGGVRGVFRAADSDASPCGAEDNDVAMSFTLCDHCRRDFRDNPLSIDFNTARRPAFLH